MSLMENQRIRTAPLSLTGTGLKTLALAAMVLDLSLIHI